jgi:HEAT repeat protein
LAHPQVRALTVRRDADGLLARLDVAGDPPDSLSERALIAFALGLVGNERAVGRLGKLVSPVEQVSTRMLAADALYRIGGQAAAAALVPALSDEDWSVQRSAIKTLQANPRPEAWPTIAAILASDAHPIVRTNAAEALGHTNDDTWAPLLASTVRDDGLFVALGAANGLLDSKSPAALDALTDVAGSVHGPVRRLMVRWLGFRLRRALRRRSARANSN